MSIKEAGQDGRSPKRRKFSSVDAVSDPTKADSSPSMNTVDKNGQSANATKRKSVGPSSGKSITTPTMPTGGISKSSLLGFQASDLVAEVTPNYDRLRSKWSPLVGRLEATIKRIPNRPPVAAANAFNIFRKQGIKTPFPEPQPTNETNYKFEFKSPEGVLLGGALASSLSVKDDRVLRLCVLMPRALLQEKDYLNNRSFQKAAFYLACIASAVKEEIGSECTLAFSHEYGNDYRPILTIKPNDEALSKYTIWITVGFPNESIPISKTLPTSNCLRSQSGQPTPFYNSSICAAASVERYDKIVQASRSTSFDDAVRLGQLWLNRRGFSSSTTSGGFGFWEWTVMCALLTRTGGHKGHALFSKQYSSLQFFKAMLQVLAQRDLRDPWILDGSKVEIPRSESPVLYDASTGVNVLFRMTPWSYQVLQHHARISLAAVNAKHQEGFQSTFVQDIAEPILQHDEVYSIKLPVTSASQQRENLSSLYDTLMRGFGDRVSLIDIITPGTTSWTCNQVAASQKVLDVKVALTINPETASRLVDHGPSAEEQTEAEDFRKFWGEKAELRRFKDGSINEALVWSPKSPVTFQIIQHLVLLHFGLPPSSVSVLSSNLEAVFLPDAAPIPAKDAYRVINNTFQALTSTLHGLEGLPLPIRSVQPCSPALRSASASHPLTPPSGPIDFLVNFDTSTRWPDHLAAIQHTKIAFLLKLSDLLTAADSSLKTRVGLENTDSSTTGYLNTSFLDIIHPSPAPGLSPVVFRLRIHHERETHLLASLVASKSLPGPQHLAAAAALTAQKRTVALPAHTNALRTLVTRHPPLAGTIALFKSWISAHLLTPHLPGPLLELLCTRAFLVPAPFGAPGTATTAFLRTLQFLSTWDFGRSPLVLDLSPSQDMEASARTALETRFAAWRKLDPQMHNVAVFAGTSIDDTGVVWSGEGRVPRVVAARLVALAAAAMAAVRDSNNNDNNPTSGLGMGERDWRGVFTASLDEYDFVIRLKGSVVRECTGPTAAGAVGAESRFKNLAIAPSLDDSRIGYNPVARYLEDLERAFGRVALFFADPERQGVIAGLWRPTVLGRKEWRVRLGWSSVPLPVEKQNDDDGDDGDNGEKSGQQMCEINREGILREMVGLGEGLVGRVSTNNG